MFTQGLALYLERTCGNTIGQTVHLLCIYAKGPMVL